MRKSFFMIIATMIFLIPLMFSCSDTSDKRKDVKKSYGEPDIIEKGGYGLYKYEIYVYARKDLNRVYDFRQSASGCGGKGNYYIYMVYYADELGYELYMPPTITHTAVVSAPAGVDLNIIAQVTDDGDVSKVELFYRVLGQTDFSSAQMYSDTSTPTYYKAEIPATAMTAAGVEYYLEAYDDEEYGIRLPETGTYSVTVTSSSKPVVIAKEADSTEMKTGSMKSIDIGRTVSPVGP